MANVLIEADFEMEENVNQKILRGLKNSARPFLISQDFFKFHSGGTKWKQGEIWEPKKGNKLTTLQ